MTQVPTGPADDPDADSAFEATAESIPNYEPYIRMLARVHARNAYRAKVGPSDVVQQVMMQAVTGLDGFRGKTEAEFRGWLRKILAHHLCHLHRDLHRDKRDIRREQSMEQKMAQSSLRLEHLLRGDGPSPSSIAIAGERVLQVAAAIDELPDDQATAIRLHHLEGLKLAEVAEAMERSGGSVAGLLHRGMKTLRERLS